MFIWTIQHCRNLLACISGPINHDFSFWNISLQTCPHNKSNSTTAKPNPGKHEETKHQRNRCRNKSALCNMPAQKSPRTVNPVAMATRVKNSLIKCANDEAIDTTNEQRNNSYCTHPKWAKRGCLEQRLHLNQTVEVHNIAKSIWEKYKSLK